MDTWLIFFSVVVALGILAQWLSWRLRMPSILALLVFGFIAGPALSHSDYLENDPLFALVSLSVAVILLEGGLTLRFRELKEAGQPVLRLVGPCAFITWGLATASLYYLGRFSLEISLLIGAILIVTGPTVVGPLLRNIRPSRKVRAIAQWEGIVIDPVGAILAVLVYSVVFGEGDGWAHAIKNLAATLAIGFGFGWASAKGLTHLLKRHWIPDFLQSVFILAVAMGLFVVSNFLQHEAGLLTVTALGVCLANQPHAPVRHIIEFKENLRIILISCLFIVLAGRVTMEEISANALEIALVSLALIAIVRPASIYLGTLGAALTRNEKIFLSLLAPRGIVAAAVSSIFALKLAAMGGDSSEADRIVPIVFGVVLVTVAFYGLTAAPIARRLGIATPNPQGVAFAGAADWVIKAAVVLKNAGYPSVIIDSNYRATQRARMAGIATANASVLSDYALEEIDYSGIGRFLAVTSNDEVNSLACMAFGHVFGRSNVYQLTPANLNSHERISHSAELSGRTLFQFGVTSADLARPGQVAEVRKTNLTAEFGMKEFAEKNGPGAIPLFVIRENGDLSVVTADARPAAAGDALISLVPTPEPTAPQSVG
jgi:NhaP-type Na+/H+ or K+/H+ antiporter